MHIVFSFINFILFFLCLRELRRMRRDINNLTTRVTKIEDKKLDNLPESGYNKEKEDFIERMIRMKLVYNPNTAEWEKLKELER